MNTIGLAGEKKGEVPLAVSKIPRRSVPPGRSACHMLPSRHAAATARSPGSVAVVLQQEWRQMLLVGCGSSVLNKTYVP